MRQQKRRRSPRSVVTVCHNTNNGNEKTARQMAAVPLSLTHLLTSERPEPQSLTNTWIYHDDTQITTVVQIVALLISPISGY